MSMTNKEELRDTLSKLKKEIFNLGDSLWLREQQNKITRTWKENWWSKFLEFIKRAKRWSYWEVKRNKANSNTFY